MNIYLLLAVAFGILLNPLNSSMISVAIASLRTEFNITFIDASWLIATFYLTSAIAQPIMGKLCDYWGRKKLFLFGLVLVTIASILAPFSPNFMCLIIFRGIQAFGSSTLYPAGMAIVREVTTKKQGRVFGVLNVFSTTSAAVGPTIGGFLIQAGDWPAIFLINFPFIIVSFVLAIKFFPKDNPDISKSKFSIDIIGIILFSVTIIGLLLTLLSIGNSNSLWGLVLTIISLIAFYFYEKRKNDPFIDINSIKRNTNLTLVYTQFILVNILFYSLFFGVPSYLQAVHELDANVTGLVMFSVAGFGILVTPLAGKWIDRKGSSKSVLLFGAVLSIMGSLLLFTITDTSSPLTIFLTLSIIGCSSGFNNLGLQTALYTFVEFKDTGIASGLFMTSRYVGTIISTSILGLVFSSTITTENFHMIGFIGVIIGFIYLSIATRLPYSTSKSIQITNTNIKGTDSA